MFKNYLIISLLFMLANCSTPGTALLGPAFTGATTKSLAQASLSFGTNQIVKRVHSSSLIAQNKIAKLSAKIETIQKNMHSKSIIKLHK
jgi:hypothetical protein